VGDDAMNPLNTILILVAALFAVFGEAILPVRQWLGAQIDLLPALMVCAALNTGFMTVMLLSLLGGLFFDSLSGNPLGISILPLFLTGFVIYLRRDLILRDLPFAQLTIGAIASAAVPAMILLLLLTVEKEPLFGWGSLWQWFVMTAGGALATPVIFEFFNWCNRSFGYQRRTQTSFRPDREILRRKK